MWCLLKLKVEKPSFDGFLGISVFWGVSMHVSAMLGGYRRLTRISKAVSPQPLAVITPDNITQPTFLYTPVQIHL